MNGFLSKGAMLVAAAKLVLPATNSERIFIEWLYANRSRLRDAIRELGVEPPAPGPQLVERIKAVVLPELERMRSDND
jgi:hypothetical protein